LRGSSSPKVARSGFLSDKKLGEIQLKLIPLFQKAAIMKPAVYFVALLAGAFLAACTSPAPLPTVAAVDLGRYYGTWYEIARLPNRFQSMCVSDTRATYRPDGNRVSVLNQ